MKYKIRFQDEMKQLAIKVIIKTLFFVMLIFSLTNLLAECFNREIEARKNLTSISETFTALYEENLDFLADASNISLFSESLTIEESSPDLQNALNRFNRNRPIKSSLLVVDTNGSVQFASEDENQVPTNLINYIHAITFSVSSQEENEVRASLYKIYNGYSNLLLIKSIFNDEKIVGYVVLQISGDDWSYYALSNFNHDGIITDKYNNIIFYNRPKLIANNYTFMEDTTFRNVTINHEAYWTLEQEIPLYGFKIFSLVYSPVNSSVFIVAIMLVVVGILWYTVIKELADTMAKRNSESVQILVNEIQAIQKQDIDHRIQMNTDDEYHFIGDQINAMLDTITTLNQRNTELLHVNNRIEISNLTAQFNPHFLYNTLEIIRNCLFFDKELAENLIVKLTRILRYSIDNAHKDVPLRTDLMYINDYMEIQKSRFEDRFQYSIDISEECMDCIVPKLVMQPIIENSLKYGFLVKRSVSIRIKGFKKEGNLYITIIDDALGMEETIAKDLNERLQSSSNESSSNGLYNIGRRLQLMYSSESGIRIDNVPGVGLTVYLRVDQNKMMNRSDRDV